MMQNDVASSPTGSEKVDNVRPPGPQRPIRFLSRRPDLKPVGRHVAEHTVIFVGVLKWVVLAIGIGLIVGLSTALFLKALEWSIGRTGQFHYYFVFLPLALVLSAALVKYLAP